MNTAMQSFGYGLEALLFCIAILGVCHNIKKAARKVLKMKQNNLVLANSRLSSKLFIRFTSKQAPYRLLRLFYKSQSALILLLLLSQSHPSVSGCDLGLSGDLRDAIVFIRSQKENTLRRVLLLGIFAATGCLRPFLFACRIK